MVDKAIEVRVSFTDEGGSDEVLTSAATAAVSPAIQQQVSNSPATGAPTISGTAQVGQTLTADTSGISDSDGLDDVSYSYQWIRNDGTGDTDISTATSSTYTLLDADEGKTIKVRVSFTDDDGNAETLTSAATVSVAAAPVPLTVSLTSEPTSHDGTREFTFHIQFSEQVKLSYKTLRDHAFTVTGGSVKGAGRMNRPSNISWRITIQPDGNGAVTIVLPITTDCEAAGAVCTGDGRKLSSGLSVIVPGPVQNSPAMGAPTITGATQVGETLTASTSGIADADGLDNVSYSYQWIRNDGTDYTDITGATSSSYTLVDDDEGKAIKVKVSFTDDADNDETLTSTATATVAAKPNSAATGAPTIGGTAQVGRTLTADISGISDKDGLTNVSFSYQWIRNDGIDDSHIGGATGSTYTLVSDDEGKTIKVKVSFSDYEGNSETLTSAAIGSVAAKPNAEATGAPTISGTARAGETLTADTSGISDADGLDNATYSYQWVRNDGTTDTDISGAADSTYTLVEADEGKTIKVKVSFTDDEGNSETLTSAATGSVAAKPNAEATGAPTISGTARVGETLTADTSDIADSDGLNNISYSYQWVRNDNSTDTDIVGATGSTYTLVSADEGMTIKVKVSFTDDEGNAESLTSDPTATVAPRPNTVATGKPTVSGTAQVGETLTADTSDIADSDGLNNISYSYQWVRNDNSTDTDIVGATGSTYTLVSEDEGNTIEVKVSFTDDEGNTEELTSAPTTVVQPKPGPVVDNGGAIWVATMTAGLLPYGHYGYSGFDGARGGSLTTTEFSIDGVTYTVKGMGASGWMYITFDREIPQAFTIEVDGTRLDSSDASFTSYSYGKTYEWRDTRISWSDGDTVELKLNSSS